MGKTTCKIDFNDNPLKIYYGGGLLSGTAVLTIHKEKTVRGIYIKVEGKAYCAWTTGRSNNKTYHTGEEIYFSERNFVIGSENDELTMSAGIYHYTFQYNLPDDLPTSVEGEYGYIRYTVVLHMDRPIWYDKTFTEAFTVIRRLDLNEDPMLQIPIDKKVIKSFRLCCCCFCCRTGNIIIFCQLAVSGFTPGQKILSNIKIINRSNQDVYSVYVQIIKIVHYFTHKNSIEQKIEEICVADVFLGNCLIGRTERFNAEITVPSIPPTDLTSCNICKVSYYYRIKGEANVCCENDPQLDIPIKIGTYPIILQSPSNLPNYSEIGGIPNSDSGLPTYEDAIGKESIIEGGSNFLPRYLVYRSVSVP